MAQCGHCFGRMQSNRKLCAKCRKEKARLDKEIARLEKKFDKEIARLEKKRAALQARRKAA